MRTHAHMKVGAKTMSWRQKPSNQRREHSTVTTKFVRIFIRSIMTMNSVYLSEAILEEKLVELWPDYPCLYDVRSPEFKDRNKQEKAMAEIAEKVEQNGEYRPTTNIHKTLVGLAGCLLV